MTGGGAKGKHGISDGSGETDSIVGNNANNDGSGSATTGDSKKVDKATTGIENATPIKTVNLMFPMKMANQHPLRKISSVMSPIKISNLVLTLKIENKI